MMKEYDVFGEIHGYFFMKSKGENIQDATDRARIRLNGYDVDMEKFVIPTLDGKINKVNLVDCDVEFPEDQVNDGYD